MDDLDENDTLSARLKLQQKLMSKKSKRSFSEMNDDDEEEGGSKLIMHSEIKKRKIEKNMMKCKININMKFLN